MSNNYEIDYNDPRLTQVESEKTEALTEHEETYAGMIDQSDQFFEDKINASKEWAEEQSRNQQEQTDFAIEQIEQQKEQAKKDYTKEQSGAFVDWRKQSNQYGANAEQMAAAGLSRTGFSESSQVSMYNTYQNRGAVAREGYNNAVLNYNNAIKDARLQNNAALAEIAYQALQNQLELSLQGFQYKNNLILEQANKKLEVDNMYYQRYQDVLNQINHENALAEEIRQYNESMAFEREQFEWQKEQAAKKSSGGSGSGGGGDGPKLEDDLPAPVSGPDGVETDKTYQSIIDLVGYNSGMNAEEIRDYIEAKVESGEVDKRVEGGEIVYRKHGSMNTSPKATIQTIRKW